LNPAELVGLSIRPSLPRSLKLATSELQNI